MMDIIRHFFGIMLLIPGWVFMIVLFTYGAFAYIMGMSSGRTRERAKILYEIQQRH